MASRSSHIPILGAISCRRRERDRGARPARTNQSHYRSSPAPPGAELHADREFAARLPRYRHHLSREEFETNHGAHADDLAQVEKFAREHGFEIVETSAARHSVVLQGSAGDFSKAFRVEMIQYEHERGRHRAFSGPIYLPGTCGLGEGGARLARPPCRAAPYARDGREESAARGVFPERHRGTLPLPAPRRRKRAMHRSD